MVISLFFPHKSLTEVEAEKRNHIFLQHGDLWSVFFGSFVPILSRGSGEKAGRDEAIVMEVICTRCARY